MESFLESTKKKKKRDGRPTYRGTASCMITKKENNKKNRDGKPMEDFYCRERKERAITWTLDGRCREIIFFLLEIHRPPIIACLRTEEQFIYSSI